MNLWGRFKELWLLPRSERRQYCVMTMAKLYTAIFYRRVLKACGKRNIVRRPLRITWECVVLANDCRIGHGCRIEGITSCAQGRFAPSIEFGDRVSVEQRCTIVAASKLSIGYDTTISYDVMITDLDHGYEAIGVNILDQSIRVTPTSIGPNCFIGAGAKILSGTVLGKQCVVGANSVVRGTYPDYSVLAGNPASVVRRYDHVENKWRMVDRAGGLAG